MFASMLKTWRQHRHISQLELALRAGVSQRHISFLETGRANPSKPMVMNLASSLDIPLREQNVLLQSAGFNAAFPQRGLGEQQHQVFLQALQENLNHAEPYPAIVLDGNWNMVMANEGALRFFGHFVDIFAALESIGNPPDYQVARLCLAEQGLAPFIDNWQELIASFLGRARRALLHNPNNESLRAFIQEIVDHPRATQDWHTAWSTNPAPAMQMVMSKDGQTFRLFTMLAHFGEPNDVTLEELSVEMFYPADEATRTMLQHLADGDGAAAAR